MTLNGPERRRTFVVFRGRESGTQRKKQLVSPKLELLLIAISTE